MISGWSEVRWFFRLAVYSLLLTFVLSCASQKVAKPKNGYHATLEKWTREKKVYESFETKLIINATYKTKEFRESYADEYTDAFMLDAERANKLKNDEIEAANKYHEFILAIHTSDPDWSDLEKREPIWALYLVNNVGEMVSPIDIKKLKEKGPAVTRFYPYFTEWSVGYTVKFPLNLQNGRPLINDETKSIKLVMTGSLGKGELVWNLKP